MDSADSSPSFLIPVTLEVLLQCHEQMLVQLRGDVAALTQAAAQQTPLAEEPPSSTTPQASPAATVSAPSPTFIPVPFHKHLPRPEAFSGELGK